LPSVSLGTELDSLSHVEVNRRRAANNRSCFRHQEEP
jgi:hypothetical protein